MVYTHIYKERKGRKLMCIVNYDLDKVNFVCWSVLRSFLNHKFF